MSAWSCAMVFSSNSKDLGLDRLAAVRDGVVMPRVATADPVDLVSPGMAWLAAAIAPVYAPYRRKVRRSIPPPSLGSDRSSMAPPFPDVGKSYVRFGKPENRINPAGAGSQFVSCSVTTGTGDPGEGEVRQLFLRSHTR